VQIATQAAKLTDNHFEVSVTGTVTAKAGERTVFLVEVVQAGIFLVTNIAPQDLEPVLAISCPTILYPYLRESVSDIVSRGGFPAVLLSHMTFEALYLQRLQEQQGAAQLSR
jgi:preprotein translocase subunit SecB